jgi:hypothetical protein
LSIAQNQISEIHPSENCKPHLTNISIKFQAIKKQYDTQISFFGTIIAIRSNCIRRLHKNNIGGWAMKRYTVAGLACILALFIGCSDNSNPLGTTTDHATMGEHQYQYTGRNENNTVIVQGWIKVHVQSNNRLTGTWHLESVNGQATDLPLGDGTLVGDLDKEDQANINLHPTFTDNNMRLIGTLQNDQFQGQWSWITFMGPMKQGAFEANK